MTEIIGGPDEYLHFDGLVLDIARIKATIGVQTIAVQARKVGRVLAIVFTHRRENKLGLGLERKQIRVELFPALFGATRQIVSMSRIEDDRFIQRDELFAQTRIERADDKVGVDEFRVLFVVLEILADHVVLEISEGVGGHRLRQLGHHFGQLNRFGKRPTRVFVAG